VAVKPGVDNQGHGNHRAVGKDRWRTAAPPATIVSLEGLRGVINQDIPDGPYILPAGVRDKIGSTGHWGAWKLE
jgi:hypothetical protein